MNTLENPQPGSIYTKTRDVEHAGSYKANPGPVVTGVEGEDASLLAGYPVNRSGIPPDNLTSGGYTLRYITSREELEALFRLRYEIFNLELKEGFDVSHVRGLDIDSYDQFHHHLVVYHEATGACVGTYRMQTSDMARSGEGFYSESEFQLAGMPDSVLEDSVEIGRACIADGHRTIRVLHLLWRGLGLYLARNRKRYLFGCCSLTSQDELEGLAVYGHLSREGHLVQDWSVQPKEENCCTNPSGLALDISSVKIPRLMNAYLAQGAKICGPPAIDRAFKTIDFLALFDTSIMTRSALSFYRISG